MNPAKRSVWVRKVYNGSFVDIGCHFVVELPIRMEELMVARKFGGHVAMRSDAIGRKLIMASSIPYVITKLTRQGQQGNHNEVFLYQIRMVKGGLVTIDGLGKGG